MRDKARTDEQRRTWQTIADQAQRISDIITDLMEYASPPQPRKAPIDVKELLHQAAAEFSSATDVQAKASRVDITCAEDAPPALADPAQVRAVIVELMRNAAIAAGSAAPSIRLSARMDDADGNVLITVRDEGCGMDATTLAAAFTPFFSSQRAGRRRGLGLPKAKRFVEINGGRIWIRSQPQQGSTVYVELPRAGENAVESSAGRDKQPREPRPGGRNERPSVQQQQVPDQPATPRPGSG
jgi:signal transduction histidine kinase